MSTTTPQRVTGPPATDALAAAETPIWDVLRDIAAGATGRNDLHRAAMRALARHFDAPYAAINVEGGSGTLDDYVHRGSAPDGRWKSLGNGLLLDVRYRSQPIAKLYDATNLGKTFAAMAVPIRDASAGTIGALVLVTECRYKSDASAKLSEMQALVELVTPQAVSRTAAGTIARSPADSAQAGVAKVGAFGSLHEFAFSLANSLKSKVDCEQASIGLVRGRHVKLLCISGLDDLYPRSPGARLIQQAMEECLDADHIVGFQSRSQVDVEHGTTGHLLHKRWHHQTGNAPVASIPFRVDGRPVAILSLRSSADRPMTRAELEKIATMLAPLIPGLLLMERAQRSLLSHGAERLRTAAVAWLRPGAWGRKIVLAGLMAFAAWVVLGQTQFVLTLPCEIVSEKTRQVAAPFDGTIAAAYVESGDRVRAGQLLLEMDTHGLRIEQEKLQADRQIAELDLSRALTHKDRAAAAQAGARIEIADAELEVTRDRIDRSKIRAPASGVILSGDVRRRVGQVVPLGAPLLAFAPHDTWSLKLKAPENAALDLKPGLTGWFTTYARPDQTQPCTVDKVEPAAEVVEGKNVFLVEVTVKERPEWMRVGMTGVARIDVGRRPVWWVNLHRIIDHVRFQMWKL